METLKERQHHLHMKGMEFIWIAVWSIPMQANLVRLVYAKWNQGASYTSCTQSGTTFKYIAYESCMLFCENKKAFNKKILYICCTQSGPSCQIPLCVQTKVCTFFQEWFNLRTAVQIHKQEIILTGKIYILLFVYIYFLLRRFRGADKITPWQMTNFPNNWLLGIRDSLFWVAVKFCNSYCPLVKRCQTDGPNLCTPDVCMYFTIKPHPHLSAFCVPKTVRNIFVFGLVQIQGQNNVPNIENVWNIENVLRWGWGFRKCKWVFRYVASLLRSKTVSVTALPVPTWHFKTVMSWYPYCLSHTKAKMVLDKTVLDKMVLSSVRNGF